MVSILSAMAMLLPIVGSAVKFMGTAYKEETGSVIANWLAKRASMALEKKALKGKIADAAATTG
jgi:hypothetical protein